MTAVTPTATSTEMQWSVAEGDVHGSPVSNVLHQESYEKGDHFDSTYSIVQKKDILAKYTYSEYTQMKLLFLFINLLFNKLIKLTNLISWYLY